MDGRNVIRRLAGYHFDDIRSQAARWEYEAKITKLRKLIEREAAKAAAEFRVTFSGDHP